jgi:hypothetical protein
VTLDRTGGLAIYLGSSPRVDSVAEQIGGHPWAQTAPKSCSRRRARCPTGR